MRVLLLGGTGAMGTSLVKTLAENGHDIMVTTRKKRSSSKHICYIQGNAHDNCFLQEVLSEQQFDAIVDFMVYTEAEFQERHHFLLGATKHYLFLSSSRVYANSKTPITEDSPRLLDVCDDKEYLATEEYALAKARQENILGTSHFENWTIIRPYITYSDQRLQLGVYEKENWLYRILQGRTLVFSKDISRCKTTLTSGDDVSRVIAGIIGNRSAFRQSLHITTPQSILWSDVLHIYKNAIHENTGKVMHIHYIEDSKQIAQVMKKEYQIKYDRLFNRCFDNSKAEQFLSSKEQYIPVDLGLRDRLIEFLNGDKLFLQINWVWEAYQDRLCKQWTPLSEIIGLKKKIKYLAVRLLPWKIASLLLKR